MILVRKPFILAFFIGAAAQLRASRKSIGLDWIGLDLIDCGAWGKGGGVGGMGGMGGMGAMGGMGGGKRECSLGFHFEFDYDFDFDFDLDLHKPPPSIRIPVVRHSSDRSN